MISLYKKKIVPFSIPPTYSLEKQSSAHLTGLLFNVFFHLQNYKNNAGIFAPLSEFSKTRMCLVKPLGFGDKKLSLTATPKIL